MAQLDLLSSESDTTPAPDQAEPASTEKHVEKAEGAYRTISEVADELDVPQHVLRFWESQFPQVRPSRMRGARRYYRPEDVDVLKAIKALLYQKGYTIRGAKKLIGKGHAAELLSTLHAAPEQQPVTEPSVPPHQPVVSTSSQIDVKSLIRELRVLKSMLTSLL